MLSITTDYAADRGCPEPYLRRIAEAGFSHLHWCHHWNTDFLYSPSEIAQIADWLRAYGLQLNDVHGSAGVEKCWTSHQEYERLAGVELVANRLAFAAQLGGDVVIMHIPAAPTAACEAQTYWTRLRRSLDALQPAAHRLGVRIALENLSVQQFATLEQVLAQYPADYLGLCYDAGHGNLHGDALERLERLRDRVIALHLHDNDGQSDLHALPFSGTVDWPRLMHILAASSYRKGVSLEILMGRSGYSEEQPFLALAFAAAARLQALVSPDVHPLSRC